MLEPMSWLAGHVGRSDCACCCWCSALNAAMSSAIAMGVKALGPCTALRSRFRRPRARTSHQVMVRPWLPRPREQSSI